MLCVTARAHDDPVDLWCVAHMKVRLDAYAVRRGDLLAGGHGNPGIAAPPDSVLAARSGSMTELKAISGKFGNIKTAKRISCVSLICPSRFARPDLRSPLDHVGLSSSRIAGSSTGSSYSRNACCQMPVARSSASCPPASCQLP